MSDVMVPPAHVPPELIRDVSLDFRGPVEELFPRLDALRDEGRVLWVETPYGTGSWLFTRAADVRKLVLDPQDLRVRPRALTMRPEVAHVLELGAPDA